MNKVRASLGLTLLAFPMVAAAQAAAATSTFNLFYDAAENETQESDLQPGLTQFVIDEMRHWQTNGIELTKDDIDAAIHYKLWANDGSGLCQNKHSVTDGSPYTFLQGGDNSPGSCASLLRDIESLINSEREFSGLGTDLLGIAGGAEDAVSDEPSHAVNMAATALVLRRVWSGTGAAAIPWDGTADTELQTLDGDLGGLGKEDLDKAVIRFRHGYFREQREADPRFSGVMDNIGDDLRAVANRLGITGDPKQVGVFTVPKLQTKNLAVWIRKDDLGLLFVYPTHFPRFKIGEADDYPTIALVGSGTLAYPFEYTGTTPPSGPAIDSPLCSRMLGRQGYLCRAVPSPAINCPGPATSDKITLVKCEEKIFITKSGPRICPDFHKIFENDPSLTDPADAGQLNPALKQTNTGSICSPEKKVIYQDDIESHACYIGFCLLQSMTGHTLVPNRNPAVINEATSPYLACVRPDPQLGLYTEIVEQSPYPLPEYLGPFLVRDFERQYCSANGNPPQALAGFCRYNDNLNAALPLNLNSRNALASGDEAQAVEYRQGLQDLTATLTGQRAAIDQSIELERKVFAKLANFINQTASLLLELKNAPLTKTACPWTGQFKSSTPAP